MKSASGSPTCRSFSYYVKFLEPLASIGKLSPSGKEVPRFLDIFKESTEKLGYLRLDFLLGYSTKMT
jgi:hypothetical protein